MTGDRSRPPAPPEPIGDPARADAGAGLEDEATLEGVALAGTAPDGLHARFVAIADSVVTASLAGARLPDLQVRGSVIDTADLANTRAPRASVHRCAAHDARLTGADLAEASLRDVSFTGCRADLASFAAARIERVVFERCDLRETTFDGAQLRDVRFDRCDLDGTSFHGVHLQRVELAGCELSRVRSLTDLRGAAMTWDDVLANAAALADAAGIRVLTDDEG